MAKKEEVTIVQPTLVENPQTGDDFYQRGWQLYTRQEYSTAIEDFNRALQFSPENTDILYALGLTLQAAGQGDKAVEVFQRTLKSLSKLEDKTRASMLSRMTRGQINHIRTGDWNMDYEELI